MSRNLRSEEPRVRRRVGGLLALTLGLSTVLAASPASADAERHCVVTVTGQKASGELEVSAPQCASTRETTARSVSVLSVIAVHYTGKNYSGSSYSVSGSSCSGWINLPAGWVNVVSSTLSGCTVEHFDGFNRSGSSQFTWSPGGNLSSLDNKTNSVEYS